jgi:hypothetical protein
MTIDTRDKTHDFKFRELADRMITHNSTGDLDGDFAHAFITLMGAANARAQAAGDAAKGEDADTANADPRVILRVLIDYYGVERVLKWAGEIDDE